MQLPRNIPYVDDQLDGLYMQYMYIQYIDINSCCVEIKDINYTQFPKQTTVKVKLSILTRELAKINLKKPSSYCLRHKGDNLR